MGNNPVNFNDPTGHSVDCGLGDAYCGAGKINVTKRSNDLAKDLPNRKGRNWISLSDSEKSILSEGGWDEGAFNDKGGVSKADASHDPSTYMVAVVIGGGFLWAGYIQYSTLVSYATINPESPVTSIGSFGEYEKDGYTYFHLPNNIYTTLSKVGIGKYNAANLINQGVINTQTALNKPAILNLVDIDNPGPGTIMELKMYENAGYTKIPAEFFGSDFFLYK